MLLSLSRARSRSIARRTVRTENDEKSRRRLRSVFNDERTGTGGDSASWRLSIRYSRGALRSRVDTLEALLRLPPQLGGMQSSELDVTPAVSVGTVNGVQCMIGAIKPQFQAWLETFLATELPQVARVCLDRTVTAIVDEYVRSAIPLLLVELLPALVRREVVTAFATVDEESPSGMAAKGAVSSAVADRLATTFHAKTGVDARVQRDSTALEFTKTHAELIGAAPGIGTLAP